MPSPLKLWPTYLLFLVTTGQLLAAPGAPQGVFSLLDPGTRIDSRVLSNPDVKGISIQYEWRDLNPADGVYDWTYLDDQIAVAAAAGKQVLLRIFDGGIRIPMWVVSGATVTYRFVPNPTFQPGVTLTIPAFWDSYYLAKKKAMINALGDRYSANPAVGMIALGLNNAVTDDWFIPHNTVADAPFKTSEVERWNAAGYTPAKVISAAGDYIDAAMAAFPNQAVAMAVGCNDKVIDAPNKGDYEARTIIATARAKWGAGRLVAERHNLSTETPPIVPSLPTPWRVVYDSQPAVGGQMLWWSYGDTDYRANAGVAADPDTTLRRSVDTGVSYGMKYIEIYQTDVLNLTGSISYARSVVDPTATPTPTPTPTPTASPTPSPTPTPTVTPTPTPTPTPTVTPTPTSTPTPTPTPIPSPSSTPSAALGVFSLLNPGARIDSRVLSNPDVKGISIRYDWRDLNPADGVYDWTYLDAQIGAAAAGGKKVLLRIADGGIRIPTWVVNGASVTYTFEPNPVYQPGVTLTIPAFWDSYYLAKKKAMIKALGDRYSANPAVAMVALGLNNAVTDDWFIPHNTVADAPFNTSEVERWYAAGYTPAKVISAAGDYIDAAMAAFPNQAVAMAVGCNDKVIDAPNKGDYEARTIIANERAKWGAARLIAESNNLSAVTPGIVPSLPTAWRVLYDSQSAVGGRMVSWCYGDLSYQVNGGVAADPGTTLRRSVDIGVSYGMKYVEIYQTDVINLPDAIIYARSVLDPNAAPAPSPTPTPTPTPTVGPPVPRGVFNLLPPGGSADPAALANSSVDGISLRPLWAALEPNDGVFDWTYLDGQVAAAQAAGKQVLLRILTNTDNIPAWVMTAVRNAGGSTFTFTDGNGQHTIPVFWDPTLSAKKTAMIAALGARYTSNPSVKLMAVSFANTTSEDWTVPQNTAVDPGYTTSEVTRWQNAGYSTQKMINAGNSLIDATMKAFPNQIVSLPVNSNGTLDYPNNGNYVAETVVANARTLWGETRLVVAKQSLSTTTPPAPPPSGTSLALWYNSRKASAGQTVWAAYGDTSYRVNGGTPCAPSTALQNSIDIGISYGIHYIELYQIDVVNLPTVIAYAHSKL